MKKIVSLLIFVSLPLFAGDMQHLKWINENGETVQVQTDRNQLMEKIREEFEETKAAREEKMRKMKYWQGNSSGILGMIPLAGAPLSVIVNRKIESYYNRTHFQGFNEYEETVDANLGEVLKREKRKLVQILKEENSALRTRLMWEEFQNNDLFKQITSDMPDSSFKSFSSRAILVLAERTEILAKEVANNTLNIDVLRNSYIKFSSDISAQLENIRAKVENDKKLDEATVRIQGNLQNISRAPASLLEKPKDGESKEERVRRRKEEEALKLEYANLEQNLQEFNMYVQGSYQIALNLGLKGKDAERMGEVVKYVGVATSLGMAYANPNPQSIMNAVVGLSSLFGKEKPDPAVERHKEVMAAFNTVFENQIKIMKNQKIIIDSINNLSEKLDKFQEENRRWFVSMNDNFEKVLGNQAVMIDAIRELSTRETVRQQCRTFLNTRFNCDFTDLQEIDGDIPHCIKTISRKKEPFIPRSVKQTINPVMIRGEFSEYEALVNHFYKMGNPENYQACMNELLRIFASADRDILYAKFYSKNYQSIYNSDIQPILFPLVDLTETFFSNPYTDNSERDLTFNALYLTLSLPNATHAWSPARTRNVKRGIKIDRFLNKGSSIKFLKELFHVPALKQYVGFLLEMTPYMDIVKPKSLWDRTLYVVRPSEAFKAVKEDPNPDTVKMLRNALYFVNVAIAQQALMSGDQLISLIDRRLDLKNRNHEKLYGALSKGFALSSNFTTHIIKNALKYTRLNYVGIDYEKNFKENLKHYEKYYSSEFSKCEYDFKKKQYKEGCNSVFVKKLFGRYKLVGRMLVFESGVKQYPVPLPSPKSVEAGKFFYTTQLYELQELKEQILEKVMFVRGAYKEVTNDLGFF